MILKIFNTLTKIEDASEEEISFINNYCTVSYPLYKWVFRKKRHVYDKTKYLNYLSKELTFPSGWVNDIVRQLDSGITMQYMSLNGKNKKTYDLPNTFFKDIQIRYYQKHAHMEAIVQKRGITAHPTRSGKTIVMASIVFDLKRPTLILVNSKVLFKQIYDNFVGTKNKKGWTSKNYVGKIGSGTWDPKLITIGMVQTLNSRFDKPECQEFLKSIEVLMLDEAHHLSHSDEAILNSYFKIAMATHNANYRLPFTATPGKPSDISYKLLVGATGNVIHRVTTKELTEEGFLTQGYIVKHTIKHPVHYGNHRDARKHGIFKNPVRNAIIVKVANKLASEGKNVLVAVTEIKAQGDILSQKLPEAITLYGDATDPEREIAFKNFADKSKPILISTLLGEGVDLPSMDAVINCTGYSNDKSVLQLGGRVITICEGKQEAYIYDFMDDDTVIKNINGVPTKKISYLKRWSTKRLNQYKKEGYKLIKGELQ